jgi:hypothetical protein
VKQAIAYRENGHAKGKLFLALQRPRKTLNIPSLAGDDVKTDANQRGQPPRFLWAWQGRPTTVLE